MLRIREIAEDELDELVAVAKDAQPREHASVSSFVDWRRQAADMVWLLAEREEETVGAGFALTGWHTPPHRAIGAAFVAPDERGAGVGIAVLDALEGWSAEHECTELEGPVSEDDEGSLAWAANHGYQEVGRNSKLVLDLTQAEIADAAPPEGVEIVTWSERPELAAGLWEVAREATQDIPGEEEDNIGTLEEWLARDMQGDSDDPRAVFVAVERGEVVGFAKLSLSPESPERAFHDLTGVKRAHRGRGIAAALKRTQIAWAKANGYMSLQTSNEVRNEPIRRLNERHGYILEPGVVIVRGTIVAS
ncbi:MAG TPA: GNAT family N-acetyltransferase [Gaiellaceae bacterium]|nr:GNAT family N-acetyltransferase [Gaiellaceae bacterium]